MRENQEFVFFRQFEEEYNFILASPVAALVPNCVVLARFLDFIRDVKTGDLLCGLQIAFYITLALVCTTS